MWVGTNQAVQVCSTIFTEVRIEILSEVREPDRELNRCWSKKVKEIRSLRVLQCEICPWIGRSLTRELKRPKQPREDTDRDSIAQCISALRDCDSALRECSSKVVWIDALNTKEFRDRREPAAGLIPYKI